jgi:hypothetical protein
MKVIAINIVRNFNQQLFYIALHNGSNKSSERAGLNACKIICTLKYNMQLHWAVFTKIL